MKKEEQHMNVLSQAISLMSKFAIAGGSIYAAWGLVGLGGALKDHNGPGIQSGIWTIAGGGLIIAAGALFNSISLT
jgi:hypothetical protein